MQKLELKIPPVVQMLTIAIAMFVLSQFSSSASTNIPGRIWMAGLFWLLGIIISLLGVLTFRQSQTTVDPRVPQETTKLVVSGVYRISRNPMYLGFLTILIGWAVYLSNFLAFILLPVFILYMNRFQIKPEELLMLEKFGNDYKSYTTKVRRWV